MKTFHRNVNKYIFSSLYTITVSLFILMVAVVLLSGDNSLYLYIKNDLFTDTGRVIFVLGFVIAYFATLLITGHQFRLPRIDFVSRIVAINFIVYGFFGFLLSFSRINLFSRPITLVEFIITTIFLIGYFSLRNRLFPKSVGLLPGVDIQPFLSYPSISWSKVRNASIPSEPLDAVVTHLYTAQDENTSHLLAEFAHRQIPVYDQRTVLESLSGRVLLKDLTNIEIESFTPPPFYLPLKRIVDLTIIFVTIPILLPFLALISFLVKLDSRGPILYRQQRVGLHGRPFTIYKFRSMRVKSETQKAQPAVTSLNDERITRLGAFLRRARLDELPQVWNVFKGDMSFIGPRPEQTSLAAGFSKKIPFYGFRHTVRPGISGWAQVNYGYASSDQQTKHKLEYDFYYIKNLSLWIDTVITFRTIVTILVGRGYR